TLYHIIVTTLSASTDISIHPETHTQISIIDIHHSEHTRTSTHIYNVYDTHTHTHTHTHTLTHTHTFHLFQSVCQCYQRSRCCSRRGRDETNGYSASLC